MDVDLAHLSQPCVRDGEQKSGFREIRIAKGATERLDEILIEYRYQNPVFICDSTTRAAAEPYLEEEFKDYLVIEFEPDGLRANEEGVKEVLSQLEACDLGRNSVPVDILVAIGGGTIHDLTRVAANKNDIPFISVPTAASTIGFSEIDYLVDRGDGGRKLIPSRRPDWILADTQILQEAPKELTEKGLNELKTLTVLFKNYIDSHSSATDEQRDAYHKLKQVVDDLKSDHEALLSGEASSLEELMQALIYGGTISGFLLDTSD